MSDVPYITHDDVQAYLGVQLTENGQATFDLMQPLLQDMINTYCNRTWTEENPPPKAVKLAFIEWMARKIQTAPDSGKETTLTSAGTVSIHYKKDDTPGIPGFVKLVLDKYRLVPGF